VSRRELRGLHLHFDCFAGIAGDMTLGALLDLGVPEEVVRRALARLPVGGYQLKVGRARRCGLEGVDVKVAIGSGGRRDQAHGAAAPRHRASLHGAHKEVSLHGAHHHEAPRHGAHGHRSWRDIRRLLEGHLEDDVRSRALAIFTAVAEAEAKLHGMPLAAVEFHEVGAIDSIVDAVGVAAALAWLQPRRITARPVPLGHGHLHCAHGHLPVPSPAALEILTRVGAPVEDGDVAMELCTPTGAAILATQVEEFCLLPPLRPRAIGYGAGDDDPADRPNLLRAVLGEPWPATRPAGSDAGADTEAVVIEANVDDMAPELCEPLLEALFAAGARDAWLQPIVMKKSRPAFAIGALCAPGARDAVARALLTHSTSLGLRMRAVERRVLERRSVRVTTPYGRLPVKLGLEGGEVLNAAPEYEPCREAAARAGVPLKEVYAAVITAYRQQG
jgi:pyridinium-3,5-bisthiocarboxylic acid mononucleotide nickel chelatase